MKIRKAEGRPTEYSQPQVRPANPVHTAGFLQRVWQTLPSVIAVLILGTLVVQLLAVNPLAGSAGIMSTTTENETGADRAAGQEIFNAANIDDLALQPFSRSFGYLYPGSTQAESQPTATPTPELTPTPTPYPRVTDAAGVPQEGMPVEDFLPAPMTCYVRVWQANIREMPATSAAILTTLTIGDIVNQISHGLDWSLVELRDGSQGFVLSSLITSEVVLKPTPTPKPTPRPTLPKITPAPVGSTLTAEQKQAIIDLAKSCLGIRYVYGAESPTEGFDCSGFTSYIYKTLFNIRLPRSARDQATAGVAVSSADIEVGDIICFDWTSPYGVCDHVGLYIGNGQYIHAAHSKGKVLESTVNFSRNPIVSIRRIIH